jgi:hypothetical protein
MMQELFKVVEKLHKLELYDDLYLFAELHLPGKPSKMYRASWKTTDLECHMPSTMDVCD